MIVKTPHLGDMNTANFGKTFLVAALLCGCTQQQLTPDQRAGKLQQAQERGPGSRSVGTSKLPV
jgi:hypothetical protein